MVRPCYARSARIMSLLACYARFLYLFSIRVLLANSHVQMLGLDKKFHKCKMVILLVVIATLDASLVYLICYQSGQMPPVIGPNNWRGICPIASKMYSPIYTLR